MAEEETKPYYGIEEVEKPINYRHYLLLFKKNFFIILTIFLITLTLTSIYALRLPDQYTATTQIMLESPANPWKGQGAYMDPQRIKAWDDEYYITQTEIMKSFAVLRQVVDDLKLTSYFEIEDEDRVASLLKQRTKTFRLGESRLFGIRVTERDPQLAAKLCNAVARAYVRKNFEDMLYFSKEVMAWLPEEGDENEIISIKDPLGNIRQMTRQDLIKSLPSIRTDNAIQNLEEKKSALEAEMTLLQRQYREKHPEIVRAKASLEFFKKSIETETKGILMDLRARAEGTLQVTSARIVEEAKPPTWPSGPDRAEMIQIPSVASIIIMIIIIILLDYFDDTIHCVEDLERKGILLPFLGPIQLVKGKGIDRSRKALIAYYDSKSEIAESFRFLRVSINFSASPESLKNLVITSCLPTEGKSFIAHNLAVSLAMDGNKTLVIDADLRRPLVHKVFQMDNASGLSNFLTSNVEISSVLKQSFVDNLSIIPSGPVSPNPAEILGSERMRHLLLECRQQFDRIIIDCPPLTGLGDGYVVGSIVGHVIVIIAAAKTPVNMVQNTHAQLNKMNIKIIGTVLNQLDMEKERYGGYGKYYYHTYRRYYNQQ